MITIVLFIQSLLNLKVKHVHFFVFVCAFSLCCFTNACCFGMMKEFDSVATSELIGSDVFFEITVPKELAYTYKIRPAQDFGTTFNNSFSVRNIPLVVVDPPSACHEIFNAEDLKGNVALVQRGECSFLSKTIRMERAGAVAIIVTDDDRENDEMYIEMVDDDTLREVNIPAGFLLGKNGFVIMSTLEKLDLKYALINLPLNISSLSIHKLNQPPWLSW